MAKIVTVAAAAVLASSGASAAMAAPITGSWSGFYVGAHAGYARAHPHWTGNNVFDDGAEGCSDCGYGDVGYGDVGYGTTTDPINESYHDSAAVVGAQAGYNIQFGPVVVGVEGDISLNNFKGASTEPGDGANGGGGFDLYSHAHHLETLRARAGIAAGKLLIFGTGGFAFSDLKHHITTDSDFDVHFKNSRGYVVGGGIEAMITPHVSLVAQGLYVDFGHKTGTAMDDAGQSVTVRAHTSEEIGTLGVNLHI